MPWPILGLIVVALLRGGLRIAVEHEKLPQPAAEALDDVLAGFKPLKSSSNMPPPAQ